MRDFLLIAYAFIYPVFSCQDDPALTSIFEAMDPYETVYGCCSAYIEPKNTKNFYTNDPSDRQFVVCISNICDINNQEVTGWAFDGGQQFSTTPLSYLEQCSPFDYANYINDCEALILADCYFSGNGPCCVSDDASSLGNAGECVVTDILNCNGKNGMWLNDEGGDCAKVRCDPTGACCSAEDGTVNGLNVGECQVKTEQICNDQSGIYAGHFTTCPDTGTGVCQIGACCSGNAGNLDNGASQGGTDVGGLPAGECRIKMEQRCIDQSGIWQGDGSTCPQGGCPAGACCAGQDGDLDNNNSQNGEDKGGLTAGECRIKMEQRCSDENGIYGGNDSTCPLLGTGICAIGACCVAEDGNVFEGSIAGQCAIQMEERCISINGIYGKDGSTCPADATGICTIGACCELDGASCSEIMEERCASNGNAFQNDGTKCTDENICVTGACCSQEGGCKELIETNCVSNDWTYRGDNSKCKEKDICLTGACCVDNTCYDVTPEGCSELNGKFNMDAICRLSFDIFGSCCSAEMLSCTTTEDCCTNDYCINGKCSCDMTHNVNVSLGNVNVSFGNEKQDSKSSDSDSSDFFDAILGNEKQDSKSSDITHNVNVSLDKSTSGQLIVLFIMLIVIGFGIAICCYVKF
eukprot:213458_1